MIMTGDRTKIRKLIRADVDKMLLWGKHEDPVFLHYNFPNLSEQERDLWYRIKAKDLRRKCFTIEDVEDNLIGYIALRDIKFLRRESEMGIVFDPNKLNKGYGTDALSSFLDLYFNVLKMKRLNLKVAKFNIRAFRCYEKCGFKISKEVLDEFEEQNIGLLTMKRIVKDNKEFKLDNCKLMTKYYYMYITKEKYLFHKEKEKLLISL